VLFAVNVGAVATPPLFVVTVAELLKEPLAPLFASREDHRRTANRVTAPDLYHGLQRRRKR